MKINKIKTFEQAIVALGAMENNGGVKRDSKNRLMPTPGCKNAEHLFRRAMELAPKTYSLKWSKLSPEAGILKTDPFARDLTALLSNSDIRPSRFA